MTAPAAIRRRRVITMPLLDAETSKALGAGQLEQTCSACGRWEAAHAFCSWCMTPTGPATWYRNGLVDERRNRRPAVAPANVPDEFRDAAGWPPQWGPCPYAKSAARPRGTPVNRVPDADGGTSAQLTLSDVSGSAGHTDRLAASEGGRAR